MSSRPIKVVLSLLFFSIATVHQGFAMPLRSVSAGVVLVAATVNGHPGTFMLDTGTERSCLDTAFAARLLTRFRSVESVREPSQVGGADGVLVSDFGIDSFHLQNLTMLSADLSARFLRAGVAIDGILGTDILQHFIVTVDISTGSYKFRKGGPLPVGEKVVTLQHVDGAYFVPVSFRGISTRLMLDTGANFTSVSSHAWSRVTARWQPESTLDGVRSTGGAGGSQFALVPRMSIGGSTARNVRVRVQPQSAEGLFANIDFDGLLGNDLLAHFILTLDLARERMYLTPNPNSQVDPYLYSTIGIQFAKETDGHFTIMAVWSPSPAATAGLKIGDLILAVNRVDTQQMSLDDLSREVHGHAGTEVDLVIESGGNRRNVRMAVRCLLCPVSGAVKPQ